MGILVVVFCLCDSSKKIFYSENLFKIVNIFKNEKELEGSYPPGGNCEPQEGIYLPKRIPLGSQGRNSYQGLAAHC